MRWGAGLLLASFLLAAFAPQAHAAQYIEGYLDREGYTPGSRIYFHVSTTSPTYSIFIIRDKWTWQTVASVSGVPGSFHAIPDSAAWTGAEWPASYSWLVPTCWSPGSYLAKFRTEDGTIAYHPFFIRTLPPGSRSRIAFLMNLTTRTVYNDWGGKSLYVSHVPGDPRHAVEVSFLRPYAPEEGKGTTYWHQRAIHCELESDGFVLEYITEWDVHANPSLLDAYDIVVLASHHEYISRPVYDALVAHHQRGGHIAFFSANDIWWQIRYEDNGQTVVGYRDYAIPDDPLYGVEDSLVTTHWASELLGRPAEALQGVMYQEYSYQFNPADYTVQASGHWAFAGTGLAQGQSVGSQVARGETDYVGPASPPLLDLLLYARRDVVASGYSPPVSYVDCAATYYEDSPAYGFPNGLGGEVFAAGTHCGWSSALPDNQNIHLITRNVIQHMVDNPPPRTSVPGTSARALALQGNTPNPFRTETVIRYDLGSAAQVTIGIYDLAGRLVRDLVRSKWSDPGLFTASWDGRDDHGQDVASGVYFCRLQASGAEEAHRMVLIR